MKLKKAAQVKHGLRPTVKKDTERGGANASERRILQTMVDAKGPLLYSEMITTTKFNKTRFSTLFAGLAYKGWIKRSEFCKGEFSITDKGRKALGEKRG